MGSTVVLGIESSCDETGAGLVSDGRLLGHAVASSMDEHARFGGVVPEIAARAHLHALRPVVRQALDDAGLRLSDVGAVAVTTGPGLPGALRVGVAGAKGLAYALGVPLYGVHHLAGHVAADTLEHGPLPDPCVVLVVSGGHTSLLLVRDLARDPIARLGDWYSELQSGRAALTKIVGLLETPVTVVPGTADLPERGELGAAHVTFSYGEESPAVRDVSLTVRQGEHLALVGATGAGKSTLAKLLTRLYDPQAGAISFGGLDLRESSEESLRSRIVFLPQEGHLFAGSIADNVRLARPDATNEEVAAALARIGALERFASLPGGLATDVQTRGVRLSSGERQLIALARVALVEPAVIVLDEATSSLDPGTERDVEQAIAAVAEGRTVITIAHRLSTAERADRVAVMEHGRLVELASHDDLVAHGERYARLWESWQAGLEAMERPLPDAADDDGGRDPAHSEDEQAAAARSARPDQPPGERA